MRRIFFLLALLGLILSVHSQVKAITPDNPGPGDVAFTINSGGPTIPISPKIYGINGDLRPSGLSGIRLGGNRWTGYNWETNNSNAGSDFFHVNDEFLTNSFGQITPPGEAVRRALVDANTFNGHTAVTVPMAGFVSADANGTVTPAETAPSSRWNEVRTRKSEIYPGSTLSLSPNLNDNFVFTDEFVNWVESNRQNGQEVMYLLDNEPSLWEETHPYLYGTTNPTFADVGAKSIATASVIKDIAPNAKVLGGVTFGWSGMRTLGNAPDFETQVASDGGVQLDKLQFNRWLLKEMAAEEQSQGRTLMDVLDVHWYPEAQGNGIRITAGGEFNTSPAVVEARVQAPRSLWDPDYIEDSYITEFILRDYSGQGNDQGVELLNRIKSDIDELKPGTLVSVSEYNYGGGNHISGAIAQADVLGIFAREGIYNASWWPIEGENNASFVKAGFEMYTDFDGLGSRFGDLSVTASTDDDEKSSVHASRSTENPYELVLVAINRTGDALEAAIQITDAQQYTTVEVFQLTDAGSEPISLGVSNINLVNAFIYEMPAFSVSTIRLTAEVLDGDFNLDGVVNAADYTVWRDTDGTPEDYTEWRNNFGANLNDTSSVSVPEPSTLLIIAFGLAGTVRRRKSAK